jgi:DNA-binding Lrp family transcriptional regulator
MDKTDMSLIMLLAANSRLSYAKLAEKLGLSVNAVHKRIQLLIETSTGLSKAAANSYASAHILKT